MLATMPCPRPSLHRLTFAATLGLSLALVLTACHTGTGAAGIRTADDGRCSMQVIMSFSGDGATAPAAEVLESVARAATVQLRYLSDIGAGLYLYELSTAGGATDCNAGLQRLRKDMRVRSVDIDARRRANSSG
jgi:hypothetical protein